MKRLKNYRADKRTYRAFLSDNSQEYVELRAQNMGHFLQRLAAHLPDEEPEIITVCCVSETTESVSLFVAKDS